MSDTRRHGRRAAVARWAERQDTFEINDVVAAHSVTRKNAAQILCRLVRDGLLVRADHGVYRVPLPLKLPPRFRVVGTSLVPG